MRTLEEKTLHKLKTRIYKDFERFLELEKSFIISESHVVLSTGNGFFHEDRKELRKELFKYLNSFTSLNTSNTEKQK